MGTQKRKLVNQDENVAKKKVVTLEVKFESNINGVIEGIADLATIKRLYICSHRCLVKASYGHKGGKQL